MPEITKAQWEETGRRLFGEDQTRWRFVCPACGNEHSIAELREQLTEEERARLRGRFAIESECIGRYLRDRVDCDWCAYGLISGPLLVVDGEHRTFAFDFAGKPFTGERDRAHAEEGATDGA